MVKQRGKASRLALASFMWCERERWTTHKPTNPRRSRPRAWPRSRGRAGPPASSCAWCNGRRVSISILRCTVTRPSMPPRPFRGRRRSRQRTLIFEPGKHLKPHRGPYNGVLRLHLGLVVPEPREKIAIRVGGQVCHWEEGKALIFDDAYEHEAWNHSEKTRVVLFVDFVKPLLFPASFINWLLMNIAFFTPFVREGLDKHKAWEKKFYAEAEALRNRRN